MALPIVADKAEHKGAAVLDVQTLGHAGVGLVAGWFGIDRHLLILSLIAAKAAGVAAQAGAPALFRRETGESLANQAADILVGITGYYAGTMLRGRPAAAEPLGASYPAGGPYRLVEYRPSWW